MCARIFRKSALFEKISPGKNNGSFSFSICQSVFELNERTKEKHPNQQGFQTWISSKLLKQNQNIWYDIQKASQNGPHRANEGSATKQTLLGKTELLPKQEQALLWGAETKKMPSTQTEGFQRGRTGSSFCERLPPSVHCRDNSSLKCFNSKDAPGEKHLLQILQSRDYVPGFFTTLSIKSSFLKDISIIYSPKKWVGRQIELICWTSMPHKICFCPPTVLWN